MRTAIFGMNVSPHPFLEGDHCLLILHMRVLEGESQKGDKNAMY